MTKHFEHEIEQLKKRTLGLCALVEESAFMAVRAVLKGDRALADAVIAKDDEIDRWEVVVEEDCLKILALYQPVAADLRFVVAVLKLNNDLERIGDLAVSIVQRAHRLMELPKIAYPVDLNLMAEKVKVMLRKSIDSLVRLDSNVAREVLRSDAEVDAMNREAYQLIQAAIRNNPLHLESFLGILSVSRNLERIADHSTNIAEDVVYLVEGEIVRHAKA